jgi:hypothetical protein
MTLSVGPMTVREALVTPSTASATPGFTDGHDTAELRALGAWLEVPGSLSHAERIEACAQVLGVFE